VPGVSVGAMADSLTGENLLKSREIYLKKNF